MAESMDTYKVTKRAWDLVIQELERRLKDGASQTALARLLGTSRPSMSRWISTGRGGENVSFRDMLRYIDRLRIPLQEVFAVDDGLPSPSPDRTVTPLDRRIASTLGAVASAMGKDLPEIARHLEVLALSDVRSMMAGHEPMRASDLVRLCRTIGVDPGAILSKSGEGMEDG